MAFLFQDQNQGTRHVGAHATKSREAPQTVLFHPDFDRRLRNCTESADPCSQTNGGKALAGLGVAALTAGGDFHPALRTSAARYERPGWNYKPPARAGKGLWHAETACPHARKSNLGAPWGREIRTRNSLTNCKRGDSDSDLFSR